MCLCPVEFNSYDEYIESFTEELIEEGLLNNDGTFTFNGGRYIEPKLSWILKMKCEF